MEKTPGLRWRIVSVLLMVSFLPLGLVGIGSWAVFGNLLEEKTLQLHRSVVESHARSIDLYLSERLRALELVARDHQLEQLRNPDAMASLLEMLNQAYGSAFVDLGVITQKGTHISYVGPFTLQDKNYSGEEWFHEVMTAGAFVSDVFMGFRQVPHCVIAVKRQEGSRSWILRATIDSVVFDRLVKTGQLGQTGDSFIVNDQGLYQTPPRQGRVLAQSSIRHPELHRGVDQRRIGHGDDALLRATVWLNDGRWMLVVQQDESEIKAPVKSAMITGSLVILAAMVLVILATVLATWHLTRRIDSVNEQREHLARDLLRSAKLASVGELATGLAHEINNPLAIISAEQTNVGDVATEMSPDTPGRDEILASVAVCSRQVERCGNVTAKMLQFGRKNEIRLVPTDVGPRISEVTGLLRKQAEVSNAELQLDLDPDLPLVLLDPDELEQVLANLINNSLYAVNGGGRIRVSAKQSGNEVLLQVSDNGTGISPEDLERIFQPFFTTKPPGQGTGLGLSVCYGIVRTWGGKLQADSRPGEGTTISIRLPVAQVSEA